MREDVWLTTIDEMKATEALEADLRSSTDCAQEKLQSMFLESPKDISGSISRTFPHCPCA